MDVVPDLAAHRHLAGAVRRTTAYSSNLYASDDQIARWCEAKRWRVLVADRAVLLLRADRDFHHVFHVAEDQAALDIALASLPAGGTYVTDLIGRGGALDALCATHAANDFVPYTSLQRMVRIQDPSEPRDEAVITATERDAPAVAAFLERLLDRFAEQLPDLDELEHQARTGRLLIVRHEDDVAGMLMYDIKGQSAQLRFWHVDTHARGRGVGRQLMRAFLSRCVSARRLVLWVISDNERSIAIYRHYHFAPDGLLDRIMILRKEPLH